LHIMGFLWGNIMLPTNGLTMWVDLDGSTIHVF
jgi:hypothetical protein